MTPVEKLRRAEEKADLATKALFKAAAAWAVADTNASRQGLIAAAKTCTNARHEVGRAEKAARGD